MEKPVTPTFPVISPKMQVLYYFSLQALRDLYLGEALSEAVKTLPTPQIDSELAVLTPPATLTKLTGTGVRGERFIPTPAILTANPRLLGYYRLLYGISKKFFYEQGPFGRFKRMEEKGTITSALAAQLGQLCSSLAGTAATLVSQIDSPTLSTIADLQVMTIGAQLRGGANTVIGKDAADEVLSVIKSIVGAVVTMEAPGTLMVENAAGREVLVRVSSDPDLTITEILETGPRPLIAIEIKGGRDKSNIYNRVGEAEKSHLKARQIGFFECWTIVAVREELVSLSRLQSNSPSTNRFFHVDQLKDNTSREFGEFRDLIESVVGIKRASKQR